jgi:hypothetical protein
VDKNGGPIPRERAKNWNQVVYTPIEDEALDLVNEDYENIYESRGFV